MANSTGIMASLPADSPHMLTLVESPCQHTGLLILLGENPLHDTVQSEYQQNGEHQTGHNKNDGLTVLEVMFINFVLLHTDGSTEYTTQQAEEPGLAWWLVGFNGYHW
jgi:hypothetical protein